MPDQEKILAFLRITGPTIPSKVAKNINTEILFASAHLSDLASQGKVKISSIKIGGTPLYYLPGQEEKIYPFAAGNLNPKDYQVLEHLRTEKVLREKELDLLSRVALRSLKDFAIPLQVETKENVELFWKWYLLSDEEITSLIKTILNGRQEISQQAVSPLQSTIEQPKKEILPLTLPEQWKEEPAKKLIREKKPQKKMFTREHTILEAAEAYFQSMNIVIEQKEIIRKNAEINFVLKVPSVVGSMIYFCKIKNKLKCDEKDISAAYMEAQTKKKPLLFLYTNELNKKAQEMFEINIVENTIVKRIKWA